MMLESVADMQFAHNIETIARKAGQRQYMAEIWLDEYGNVSQIPDGIPSAFGDVVSNCCRKILSIGGRVDFIYRTDSKFNTQIIILYTADHEIGK